MQYVVVIPPPPTHPEQFYLMCVITINYWVAITNVNSIPQLLEWLLMVYSLCKICVCVYKIMAEYWIENNILLIVPKLCPSTRSSTFTDYFWSFSSLDLLQMSAYITHLETLDKLTIGCDFAMHCYIS